MRRHGWSCQIPVRQALERDEDAVAVWKAEVWPQIKEWRATWAPTSASRTRQAGADWRGQPSGRHIRPSRGGCRRGWARAAPGWPSHIPWCGSGGHATPAATTSRSRPLPRVNGLTKPVINIGVPGPAQDDPLPLQGGQWEECQQVQHEPDTTHSDADPGRACQVPAVGALPAALSRTGPNGIPGPARTQRRCNCR
jgi:hypothetical protein